MNFISHIFSGSSNLDLHTRISKTLIKLKLDSLQPLSEFYMERIIEALEKRQKAQQALKCFIMEIDSATTIPSFIKILTITLQHLRRQNYSQVCLEQIEELQLRCSKHFDTNQNKWVKDLNISFISFLGRLSSFADVFKRALGPHKDLIQNSTLSIDLLRMTNLYSLLFPHLNTAMNTVGRYYKKTYLFFQEFYNIVRALLNTGYQYMKFICEKFMNSYKTVSGDIIEIFNRVIPEVELLCDQMQEFMTSKYYKGRGLSKKIYFHDDKIQELNYHLSTQKRQKMNKEQEQLDTADSNYFSNAKKTSFLTQL